MAEEDEAFKAILALDSMIYDAEQLDEQNLFPEGRLE